MSLVYALHSLILGLICLNWSAEKAAVEIFHRIASIQEYMSGIILIRIGFFPV